MARTSYRPLAGCKLFHDAQLRPAGRGLVTVPLRGVSCFIISAGAPKKSAAVTVPLRGVSCFVFCFCFALVIRCYRPLAGCKLFQQ